MLDAIFFNPINMFDLAAQCYLVIIIFSNCHSVHHASPVLKNSEAVYPACR